MEKGGKKWANDLSIKLNLNHTQVNKNKMNFQYLFFSHSLFQFHLPLKMTTNARV